MYRDTLTWMDSVAGHHCTPLVQRHDATTSRQTGAQLATMWACMWQPGIQTNKSEGVPLRFVQRTNYAKRSRIQFAPTQGPAQPQDSSSGRQAGRGGCGPARAPPHSRHVCPRPPFAPRSPRLARGLLLPLPRPRGPAPVRHRRCQVHAPRERDQACWLVCLLPSAWTMHCKLGHGTATTLNRACTLIRS